MADRRNSNSQLLQELESLSQSMYQSHTARRTTSLALPRLSTPSASTADAISSAVAADDVPSAENRRRPRRMSMSPWRFRPETDNPKNHKKHSTGAVVTSQSSSTATEKKGIWSWKPMRALSHIGMQRIGCLFSVEVVAVQGLPPTMNGLRLCATVRKKETKDGAVQTMPARVLQGAAEFEETLFIRCHVYCSGGAGTEKPLKFESRLFLISAVAVDAPELDFGRSTVDLSQLMRESVERSVDGSRVRQWDANFELAGKAKGGELVVKLGFQIMEDGGVGIYNQVEGTITKSSNNSFARKQSKFSFSVSSPRSTRLETSLTPSKVAAAAVDLKGIDDFSLDEPAEKPPQPPPEAEETKNADDLDFPEFEVVDKGIEVQSELQNSESASKVDSKGEDDGGEEVEEVKEVVHDSGHLMRLSELDDIAKQIKALESIIDGDEDTVKMPFQEDDQAHRLDTEEETVTREFLQMLELEDSNKPENVITSSKSGSREGESNVFISDLGKGIGCVVQTRDGGYLASMNPFGVEVPRKQTPKLAMQISKPFVLKDEGISGSGFEVFQRLAAIGAEELGSKIMSLAAMDELHGKTAEQIAFEGIASAIISGRSKEGGATSSAARSVMLLKSMAAAMNDGRRERVISGIWNVNEEPVSFEEVLALSLQKLEAMAVEALKVQANVADEEAPFDVSPVAEKTDLLASVTSLEGLDTTTKVVTMLAVVQLRDPLRRYEAVGAPAVAVVQASKEVGEKYKVGSLHVGGLKLGTAAGRRSAWDGEKQRLTAMQWLVAYGLTKGSAAASRKKGGGGGGGATQGKEKEQDILWSLSSRVMADMWLKHIRNPNVKLLDK